MFKKILIMCLLGFFSNCFAAKWECINRAALACNTWRMETPTGWIVSSDNGATGGEHGYGMVFVPDEKHEWKI